jgi:hypothetical protein
MAGIWMATGVGVNNTASLDTFWNGQMASSNYNYAYLGITPPSTPNVKYTWPTGSRGNNTLKDFQMYTPYPTGTTRGKLYFIQLSAYTADSASIASAAPGVTFASLNEPAGNAYYIITPSLNDPTFAAGSHIVQYAFADEDDLFQNGWKSQRGLPSNSSPLASEGTWATLINNISWTQPPFSFNLATPGDKAKIVANILAYTENSYTIQNTLGLSPGNLVKGAVVLGGATTPFSITGEPLYAGIVPLLG